MANAHAWRHRNGRGKPCPTGCVYCSNRPKDGKVSNKNGHRRNPSAKRRGKRSK